MSDITINNEENQNNNQKTTPVTEPLSGPNNSSFSSPGGILLIWLERKNLFQTFDPDEDGISLNQDIDEIRALLDEDEEQ